MGKFYNVAIILSFIGLWINSILPEKLEITLGFLLIFSFGILHGSNDILILNTIQNRKSTHPISHIIMTYVLVILGAVLIFYFLPALAVILFIVFSGFHFGEQHWEHKNLNIPEVIRLLFYLLYGLFVLNLLFVSQPHEVISVVETITNRILSESLIQNIFTINAIAFGVIVLYLVFQQSNLKSQLLSEGFYLLLFAIIFKVGTLIWSFTIYFIFWHSIPSLIEQIEFIYGDVTKKTVWTYCKKALPYWLTSIIGIAFMIYVFKDTKLFYALFFSFIAAVTFPHTIVITKLFKNKKTQH